MVDGGFDVSGDGDECKFDVSCCDVSCCDFD